jgi:hypothetical protein
MADDILGKLGSLDQQVEIDARVYAHFFAHEH